MIKAFVFGKFLPFHKGHQALIHFALTKCDFLSVLVCASDLENIPASLRKNWIEETFHGNKQLEVKTLNYSEDELPNTSESSRLVSKLWADIFKKHFPDYSLVVTSEKYGEYVADFMNIRHISFDPPRIQIPVSATNIRKDLFAYWKYLPDHVKPYFIKKVVILGTESSGKTSLVEKLSQCFNCRAVFEAGRDLIPDSKNFVFEDLIRVAELHAKRIKQAVQGDSPLLIIDTDIHITLSYAEFSFGKTLAVKDSIYKANRADLYLYLTKDVPFIQDGTRLEKTDRDLLDRSHRKILEEHKVNFVEIGGSWEARFEQAKKLIQELIFDASVD